MLITERKIYMLAARPSHLEDGLALQKKQHVSHVHFKNKEKSIQADVSDHQTYHTVIRFNEQNAISSFSCECEEAKYLNGACKHVIATLKQAQIIIENARHQQVEMDRALNEILNCFADPILNESIIKQPIKVEIHLQLSTYSGRPVGIFSLKVGMDKMYVVKNIREFLQAFEFNEEIEYGKNFTLYPEYHELPQGLRKFFKTLDDIQEEGHDYFKSPKELLVNEHYLKKLIQSLKHQKIYIDHLNEASYQVFITDDCFSGLISISDQKDTVQLDLSEFKKVIPITSDYHYILYDYQIYHLHKVDLNTYMPFFRAATLQQDSIKFKGKHRQEFIGKVIPFLPKNVEIPDTLKSSYIQLPLMASLYLDKQEQAIIATLMFRYGNYEFNPIKNKEDIVLNDKILIREIKKEEEFINILDNANFKVQPESLYIDQEKDVIAFVEKYLPILKANMDIFYSDSFKSIVKKRTLSSSIRYNESSQLFDVQFKYDDISFSELKDIMRSYKLKQKYYRLLDGSFLSLDDKQTQDFIETLSYLDISLDELKKSNIQLTLSEALFLNSAVEIDEYDDHFNHLINSVSNQQLLDISVPEHLSSIMRDYQINGYRWLKTLNHYHLGGVLADDMGLGKTLQAIAFLDDEAKHDPLPNLIICPTSLVYNWEDEIKRFAPNLRYLVVSGQAAVRKELIQEISSYQVIISSYPLLRKDIQYYQNIQFNHCILDEAQYIKNPSSLNAKTVKLLKAKTRYALTGTPMENSLEELWSIFDFVMPGMLLSHYKFREIYEIPIIKDENKAVRKKLVKRIQPFILRRMKTDVLSELPDKIESKYTIELTNEQKELYLATLEETRQSLHKELKDDEIEKNHIKIFAALTRLRQLCNHPSLFIQNYYGGSGKLDALNEIIDEAIENNHKILIFSQFTSMLHIIEDQLKIKEISYGYLDGSTPMEMRGKYIKEFNEGDIPIFLISLKAGGTGLNLTGANMVIHVDPWWNPAVEQQATDRAYRIGQTKNVQVIKLVTKGTIEEKIYELQQRKLSLIDSIIQPGETFISKLTKDEIIDLFK